ncbi:hypothetical protein BpHYR1_004440 [Brachionus plicatilis]|uniref:Uncharacterized protein n=1 Tax=Brachionus plicatilis TaxID=10195 RepID=A0A3M7RNU6_BRAPC|nr:hypothetical protein BpHYR1_004440 [Brachionus plicatilis]
MALAVHERVLGELFGDGGGGGGGPIGRRTGHARTINAGEKERDDARFFGQIELESRAGRNSVHFAAALQKRQKLLGLVEIGGHVRNSHCGRLLGRVHADFFLFGTGLRGQEVVVAGRPLIVLLFVADHFGQALADERLGHICFGQHDRAAHFFRIILIGLFVDLGRQFGKVGDPRRPNARQEDFFERAIAQLEHKRISIADLDHFAAHLSVRLVTVAAFRLGVVLPQTQLGRFGALFRVAVLLGAACYITHRPVHALGQSFFEQILGYISGGVKDGA